MRTTRCPHCFSDLAREPKTAFACSSCEADKKSRDRAALYGAPEPRTMINWVDLQPTPEEYGAAYGDRYRPAAGRCEGCGRTTDVQACPICTFHLPPKWRTSLTTAVAMAGARASGKSVYIAVLARQLELLFSRGNRPFMFADDESRKVFRERYEEPLLVQRELLRPTPPGAKTLADRAPMIFAAGDIPAANNRVRPHFLVLRDVAGEDLEPQRSGVMSLGPDGAVPDFETERFDFFKNADGIVFLIDPMRVDGIRQLLMGQVDERQVGGDPLDVLARVMSKVKSSPVAHRPQLCLTLSKFDVLELLDKVTGTEWAEIMSNRGAAFLRDPSLAQFSYDDADGRLLHEEALSLLEKLNADRLALLATDSGVPTRMFVVSALGQHGDAGVGKLNDRGISPFRVVDPLKWLLATSGVVGAWGLPSR